ncbi:MAG: hypothetical protein GX548_06265 [Lentisphaerae bacterium]|nr:hypothetical protein [Lentisphaerota bacterium]
MNQTKLTLLLAAALLAGVCIGFFANAAIIRARIQRFSRIPANMPEHITHRLAKRLDLNEEQRRQVLAVFEAHSGRMQEAREQNRALIESLIEEARLEIARHLTPEQQEEHKQILAEIGERHRKNRALIRAFRPPPPPPEPNGGEPAESESR